MLSSIYILLIFIIGFFISYRIAKELHSGVVYLVFLMHMLFSFLYYLFTQTRSADANMYYYKGMIEQDHLSFGIGTDFIVFLSGFFQKLGFDKISLFFLFGLFGFIGYVYLLKMLPQISKKFFGISLFYIVLLLPGFHFWTSALGKDSLFFMALMMFFYSIQKLPSGLIRLIFSFLILATIRPHMGFILLLSVLTALFFRNPAKYKFSHLIMGVVAIIVLILFLPFVLEFLNIDQMQIEEVNRRFEDLTNYGAQMSDEVSSYVDMSNASLPTKLFAYLFRPLFFDAHSFMQLAASFENFILLSIILSWLKSIRFNIIKWYKAFPLSRKIMAIYIAAGWLILSMGMYNLGLASRQKYMLIPVIFIIIFDVYIQEFFYYKKNNYVRN